MNPSSIKIRTYRGRLAPSPTGLLHVGHARTFWIAAQRAAERGGVLVLRNEDLDAQRCRPEFVDAMIEDLLWLGIRWQEGPECGGSVGPYTQSERRVHYLAAWKRLWAMGAIYPCSCSRKDVALSAGAPNDGDDEPLYSGKCRPKTQGLHEICGDGRLGRRAKAKPSSSENAHEPSGFNWRFRVPDNEAISFIDQHLGPQTFVAGRDFGDFIVWRRDDVPTYQLAVVVDDSEMHITEVVRGADLLKSTARQILLYRALGLAIPDFYHCDLVRDETGVRLAKRHDSLSIRKLRELGWTPEHVRSQRAHLADLDD